MNPILNHDAGTGATLTLAYDGKSTTVDLYSRAGLEMLANLWVKAAAESRLMYEPTWLGRPIIQFPTDMVMIQELIWKVRPDVIIETGVAHGGSLVLSASICELLKHGDVVGIDIEIRPHNRAAIEAHPLAKRIRLIEGSSTSPQVLEQVRVLCAAAKTVMIILDSCHDAAHVERELDLYSGFVTPGSYIVVHDGAQALVSDIPRGKQEWRHDNPLVAIERFLAKEDGFEVDGTFNRMLITSSPSGFLRRRS